MLKNYFKIAWRNLTRNKGYTFINIFGLAVGFACCILIATYIRDEMSHEDFQQYENRLVVMAMNFSFGNDSRTGISTPYPLASRLEQEAPAVQQAVRTMWPGSGEISLDGKNFHEEKGIFHAEEGFFKIFSFPFVKGSPKHALREPGTAVISKALAQKLFPNKNPIGQTLYANAYGSHAYRIIGVAKSHDNSYLDFNAVLSFSTLDYAQTHADMWLGSMFHTFVLLQEGTSLKLFKKQVDAIAQANLGKLAKTMSFIAKPISNLYLSNLTSSDGFHGQWRYLYIFAAVALFILIIACVNYVNLSTARASRRAEEVGVRKTVGANRGQLIFQFIGESVLVSIGAFILGLLMTYYTLPAFNYLFSMQLSFAGAGVQWFLILAGLTVIIGILAGSYPALYLSRFESSKVLKSHSRTGTGRSWLQQGLLVTQFTIAVVLMVSTLVVFRQLQFTQKKDLGFNGEQVVITNVPDHASKTFRREILESPLIVSASVTNSVPGQFMISVYRKPDNISTKEDTDKKQPIRMYPATVDYGYINTLQLELIAGRSFSKKHVSDKKNAFIINQTAAQALGWTAEEAIGKPIAMAGGGKVIGVVKDFHIASFHQKIEPVVMSLHEFQSVSAFSSFMVRLKPESIQAGLRYIENIHSQFTSEPFNYTFLDQKFAQMYSTARRLGQVFSGFAMIAIFLACLGLFGLVSYTTERRTKEIGIRKVMGATVTNIVGLLSKDFLKLVLIGFVMAVPIAFYFMNQWLQGFAYRIEMDVGMFLIAGGVTLLIALATVSWQSVRAALANPVDSLRSE